MRNVPEGIEEAFFSGKRSSEVPFAINDCVKVIAGDHLGKGGAVISIESVQPEVTVRVELGADGMDVVVPVGHLKHHDGGPEEGNTE